MNDGQNEILPECQVRFDEQKDDKRSVLKISIAIISVLAMFVLAGFVAWGDVKDEVSDNTKNVCVIQKELDHIKETTDRIEQNQIDPDEILEAIEAIVKGE